MTVRDLRTGLTALAIAVAAPALAQADAMVTPPAALVLDQVPPVPVSVAAATRPYMEFRTAGFLGWDPTTRGVLIATRFGNAAQIHLVAMPGGARTQLSFEPEPVASGQLSPGRGDVLLVAKDKGGDEFFQLFRLANGRLELLTDGRSRNTGAVFSKDGALVGFSSTRRNGTDTDLYIMDPRKPGSTRLVAQVQGGGWGIADFAPGGGRALVAHYISVQRSELFEVDLATGKMVRLTPEGEQAAYGEAKYAPDGTIYVTSDRGSDFQRLGVLSRDGRFRAINPEPRWDVEDFDVAPDGRFIAYTVNEAGVSKLRLLDPATGRVIVEPRLPAGAIGGLEVAPWGAIGFSLSAAGSPTDVYALDPASGQVTRWTRSETGGLDPSVNREPELVTVRSFDGLEVSGFLYRPDPARFPGKRPVIVDIHGGPEAQSRPTFRGRVNYLVNEMGLAVFYPNVRGSTGYGKRFVSLDNGPFLREDSVKDIGAFLDALGRDPGLDSARIAVTGGSYGGYMCYASAIRYGMRLRSALCTVAISNFVTFLENTQGYRRDLRRVEYGDERDPRQRAKLLAISPLTRASEIRIPLMVVTGANDPRVPASEAEQMVAAVRKNGGRASHLLARDEGHGFAKKANQDYLFWATVGFWQETLLGQEARATR